jgi:DNA-binding transcriptional regulator PaaX
MKRKTKDRTREITQTVLRILAVAGFMTFVGLISNGRNADKLLKGLCSYSIVCIKQTIRRLKLQGMIEYDEEDESHPIILTEKGMRRALKHEFTHIFSSSRRWDHFWRIVMFDIPERKGKRRAFQHGLKMSGFYRVQDSVYASPFDLKDELLKYARAHGISSDVLMITAPTLGPFERDARMHFFRFGCRLR